MFPKTNDGTYRYWVGYAMASATGSATGGCVYVTDTPVGVGSWLDMDLRTADIRARVAGERWDPSAVTITNVSLLAVPDGAS